MGNPEVGGAVVLPLEYEVKYVHFAALATQDKQGTSPVHLRFLALQRSQARVIRRRLGSGPALGGDACNPAGGEAWVCWIGVKEGWCGLPEAIATAVSCLVRKDTSAS